MVYQYLIKRDMILKLIISSFFMFSCNLGENSTNYKFHKQSYGTSDILVDSTAIDELVHFIDSNKNNFDTEIYTLENEETGEVIGCKLNYLKQKFLRIDISIWYNVEHYQVMYYFDQCTFVSMTKELIVYDSSPISNKEAKIVKRENSKSYFSIGGRELFDMIKNDQETNSNKKIKEFGRYVELLQEVDEKFKSVDSLLIGCEIKKSVPSE